MEVALSAAPAAATELGRGYLESRKATQDGFIWPIERRHMSSAGAIRERMVEDIGRLIAEACEGQPLGLDDLRRKGWPPETVAAHGVAAFTAWKAQFGQPRRRRQCVLETAAEAAALLLFSSAVILWAGIGTGAL
jgi:hypothetical protein